MLFLPRLVSCKENNRRLQNQNFRKKIALWKPRKLNNASVVILEKKIRKYKLISRILIQSESPSQAVRYTFPDLPEGFSQDINRKLFKSLFLARKLFKSVPNAFITRQSWKLFSVHSLSNCDVINFEEFIKFWTISLSRRHNFVSFRSVRGKKVL